MSVNFTSFAAALKSYYTPDKIESLAYSKSPFLAALAKKTDATGENYVQPVITDTPQGQGSTFATAQTNASAGSLYKYTYTWSTHYVICTIDGKTMRATRNDRGAFMQAAKYIIDAGFNAAGESLSEQIYGDGTTTIGTASAGTWVAAVVGPPAVDANFLIATPSQINAFHIGMVLVCNAHVGTVSGLNRQTGRIYLSATGLTIVQADIDGGNTIARQGMATTANLGLIGGLNYMVPTLDATAAGTIYSLNRTPDIERLAGIRYNAAAAADQEDALIDAGNVHNGAGGRPDRVYMNPLNFGSLVKTVGAKQTIPTERVTQSREGSFGFTGLRMYLPSGPVDVFPDRYCPKDVGWLTKQDTWKLVGLGEIPGFLHHASYAGQGGIIQPSADGVELRIGWYAQLVCTAPLHTMRVALPVV